MKKVRCRKTGHAAFMTVECRECETVHTCDVEALENKNPFDDVNVDHL